jgi:hypothetical protein
MLPMAVFLAVIFGVIVVGLMRSHPAAVVSTADPVRVSEAVGVILILKALAACCPALTGIEAIANLGLGRCPVLIKAGQRHMSQFGDYASLAREDEGRL